MSKARVLVTFARFLPIDAVVDMVGMDDIVNPTATLECVA